MGVNIALQLSTLCFKYKWNFLRALLVYKKLWEYILSFYQTIEPVTVIINSPGSLTQALTICEAYIYNYSLIQVKVN